MNPNTLADMITDRILYKAAPDDSVRKACIMMSSANIGALPVVNEDGSLVGMISERDVIKRSVIVYRPSEETPVSQIMTNDPKWLPPEAPVSDAVQMMREGRFRHLPICRDGIMVGIVSIRDFDFHDATISIPVRRTASRQTSSRAGHS